LRRTKGLIVLTFFFCLMGVAFAQTQNETTGPSQEDNAQIPQAPVLKSGDVEKEFPSVQVDAQKEFPSMQVDEQKKFPSIQVDAEKQFPSLQVNAQKEFPNS